MARTWETKSMQCCKLISVWGVRIPDRVEGLSKAGFPLGEFVRENREKKQLDWQATNTDVTTSQSHSLLACSREQIRQVENRLKGASGSCVMTHV